MLAALSLDFDDTLTAAEVERAVSRLERRIKQAHPEIRRIFVEAQSREGHLSAREDMHDPEVASAAPGSTSVA